jgi:hypothetical protein
MSRQEEMMCQTILTAAYRCIGLKQLRTRNGLILNEEVRRETQKRDLLRAEDEVDWQAVQQAEETIIQKSKTAAAELWQKKVAENANTSKMWDLLKSLKNGPAKQEGDRILVHKGCGRTSKKSKANAFAAEYASVSRLHAHPGDPQADEEIECQTPQPDDGHKGGRAADQQDRGTGGAR